MNTAQTLPNPTDFQDYIEFCEQIDNYSIDKKFYKIVELANQITTLCKLTSAKEVAEDLHIKLAKFHNMHQLLKHAEAYEHITDGTTIIPLSQHLTANDYKILITQRKTVTQSIALIGVAETAKALNISSIRLNRLKQLLAVKL